MTEFYLKDIKHEYQLGERVCDWDYIEPKGRKKYLRLYYAVDGNKNGFMFYALQWVGNVASDDYTPWKPEETMVDCLYNGIAFFDGIRHLYMGDKQTGNYGYDYYATLEDHVLILAELRKLELKYCRDCD